MRSIIGDSTVVPHIIGRSSITLAVGAVIEIGCRVILGFGGVIEGSSRHFRFLIVCFVEEEDLLSMVDR